MDCLLSQKMKLPVGLNLPLQTKKTPGNIKRKLWEKTYNFFERLDLFTGEMHLDKKKLNCTRRWLGNSAVNNNH